MRRLMEEHLYWVMGYARYVEEEVWKQYKDVFFGRLGYTPAAIDQIRENMRTYLHGQGVGRHSRAEVYALGNADLTALSAYLEDRPYFLGKKPTALDATAYGFLANIYYVGYETPLEAHAKALPNLRAYCERMRQRYYSTA
jgi:glutathione S-transferase